MKRAIKANPGKPGGAKPMGLNGRWVPNIESSLGGFFED